MDFDPLSFFTPDTLKSDAEILPSSSDVLSMSHSIHQRSENQQEHNEGGAIHILDLPALNLSTPRTVIHTILLLLNPGQETNFGQQNSDVDDDNVLRLKGISEKGFNESREWLEANGYTKLSKNLLKIQFSQDIFQFLNNILSSRAFQEDEEIIQLTSMRISENCGRTARPNFQRKIIIKKLTKPILLNEPALTSDSLGLKTWGSSLMLSEFIVENKDDLLVPPILELGSGTGLVGITIGTLGYEVTLTDLPEILPNLVKNRDLNGIESDCLVLDWTDPSSFIEAKGCSKFKTIVIADPIYSPEHPRYVVDMICQFLENSTEARVLLQIPIRSKFEKEREYLWDLLKVSELLVKDERIMDGFDDFGPQQFIYKEIRWAK